MRAAALVLLLVCALPRQGVAATRVCLEVRADETPAGFQRLVESELARHPSHVLSSGPCDSVLQIELFTASGVRYLTARINREVPVRYSFRGGRELEERVSEALRLVLEHDPVHLSEDPTRYSLVQRALHTILQRGHNLYRIEGVGVIAGSGAGAAYAAGGALMVSRGAEHLRVFARAYAAGASGSPAGEDRLLRVAAGLDVGPTYEVSARADTSFYVSPGLGVQLLRFLGQAGDALATAQKVDAAFSARIGVRFLRTHDFDLDAYAALYLPLFNAQDPDSPLPKSYTPSLQLGLGVGFGQ